MDWLEKDVEDYIVANPTCIDCDHIYDRQVAVGVGIIDVVAYRDEIDALFVVEIKKGPIDCNAVGQLTRYINALRILLNDRMIAGKYKPYFEIKGLLVGNSVDTDAMALATELEYEVKVYQPRFVADLSNCAFKPLSERLDTHKYQMVSQTFQELIEWLTPAAEDHSDDTSGSAPDGDGGAAHGPEDGGVGTPVASGEG